MSIAPLLCLLPFVTRTQITCLKVNVVPYQIFKPRDRYSVYYYKETPCRVWLDQLDILTYDKNFKIHWSFRNWQTSYKNVSLAISLQNSGKFPYCTRQRKFNILFLNQTLCIWVLWSHDLVAVNLLISGETNIRVFRHLVDYPLGLTGVRLWARKGG